MYVALVVTVPSDKPQIRVSEEQRELLNHLKKTGETYEDAVRRAIEMTPEEIHSEVHKQMDETMQAVVPKGDLHS